MARPAPLPVRPAPPPGPGHERFRPDVEGLRGLAILLVVAFHAAPTLVGGGYIGVDVFFVISGFLITGLLYRELGRAGRIDLRTFYARRIRRLLPAATLALGATFLLSAWLVPPLDLPRVAGDGVAAALSVSNIRFALASGDYFSAIETPSPFLHYWSLSVEEQFYLVWPATLIIAFALGRGPRGVAVVVSLVTIGSLVAALALTDVAQAWAFYSLPTRAWQLAIGGLLAIGAIERHRGRWLSAALALGAWLGLGAVLLAGINLDDTIAYPGAWALIPTLGAAALIAGGDRPWGPGVILRSTPVRFTGRISYALYLWHWPLLVLPAIAAGAQLPALQRLALVGLAFVIASASTILVEEPIRRGSAAASGRRQAAVVGALGLALLLVVSVGAGAARWVTDAAIAASRGGTAAVGDGSADPAAGSAGSPEDGPGDAVVVTDLLLEDLDALDADSELAGEADAPPPDAPGPSPTPTERRARRADRRPEPTARPGPTKRPQATRRPTPKRERVIALPRDVRPSVWDAREDEELLRRNGCLEAEEVTRPGDCSFGRSGSRFIVALVGDSHASHWFPALSQVAADRGWRLDTFVKVSCPFTDMAVRNLELKREYRECRAFNENVVEALGRLKPDLVVTAVSRWQHPMDEEDESAAAQGAAMARMLRRVPGRKVVIADVPYPDRNVPACLSRNLDDIRPCAVAGFNRFSGGSPARERIAAQRSGGSLVDFGRVICGGPGDCPVVNHGRIVFRDTHHLTATFSRWLAPALDRALQRILAAR